MSLELLLLWLSLGIYHEARGEPLECKRNVAEVILNRSKDGDIERTLMSKGQFSGFPAKFASGVLKPEHRPKGQAWIESQKAAKQAVYGNSTHGATHFHALHVSPAWASKKKFLFACGNHKFFM